MNTLWFHIFFYFFVISKKKNQNIVICHSKLIIICFYICIPSTVGYNGCKKFTKYINLGKMAKFIFYISFVHRAIKFLFWRRVWDTDHKNDHKVWFDICTSFEVLCKSEKGLKNNIDFNNTYPNSLS